MQKVIAAVMLVCAVALPGAATAEQGDVLVRARVINIDPNADSSLPLDVDNRWGLEVDFTYFLTKNLAAELILTYPQKHDVTLGGAGIGSVKHIPATVNLQYHFMPDQTFRPYVGAGFNYTIFTDRDLANDTLEVDSSSFGAAVQAGFDYQVTKAMFLNVDVKYLWISTDVTNKVTGANVTSLDIDPWVYGVGVGWKF